MLIVHAPRKRLALTPAYDAIDIKIWTRVLFAIGVGRASSR